MICVEQGVRDDGPDAYRPQEIVGKGGRAYRFPEIRLMPGPKYLARRIRRIYTLTGIYPVIDASE
jgi:hypothetical protein